MYVSKFRGRNFGITNPNKHKFYVREIYEEVFSTSQKTRKLTQSKAKNLELTQS
jgi:hypothetical protein